MRVALAAYAVFLVVIAVVFTISIQPAPPPPAVEEPAPEPELGPDAAVNKLLTCLDDAILLGCEQARIKLEGWRKRGYEGIEQFADYKDDCLLLGVDLGGDIPDQILTWDSTYKDHTGYRTRVRAWKYTGDNYETYVFVDEQGAPIACSADSVDHETKTSRCYLEITESINPSEERT